MSHMQWTEYIWIEQNSITKTFHPAVKCVGVFQPKIKRKYILQKKIKPGDCFCDFIWITTKR